MNFSGFNTVNRKDGLGAEFIVGRKENDVNHGFILDPDNFMLTKPTLIFIYHASFQPLLLHTQNKSHSRSGHCWGRVRNFNVRSISTRPCKIEGVDYPLTANYSAPYGLWLSKYNLGAAGYWSLINKEANLIMPHLYMLEPFNPNKKIIVFVHGLASSPEAWVSLTNDIMGDAELRKNYQVWQVFYSTNMPILKVVFRFIHC